MGYIRFGLWTEVESPIMLSMEDVVSQGVSSEIGCPLVVVNEVEKPRDVDDAGIQQISPVLHLPFTALQRPEGGTAMSEENSNP